MWYCEKLNAQPTVTQTWGRSDGWFTLYHVFPGLQPRECSADAKDVIFIDQLQALHAGVKATQGSFLPFDGWVVEDGKLTSIESATVAGDFLELLQSIIFVEKEAELTPAVCPGSGLMNVDYW